MEWLNDFLAWAWDRHHNVLSWYIRPLFLLPFCYFAYRRSLLGISLTLFALATSMFWSPKPEHPDPKVLEFLEMEKAHLTGDWTLSKALLTLVVPISLAPLALAFWKRSMILGLVVMDALALGKVAWSFYYGGMAGGLVIAPPALAGLVICNAVVLLVARKSRVETAARNGWSVN
jgi:hypothetical protein